jgi:hypothetical protein
VQGRRAQAPLQHRREKRASKAGALVVGIDEQLVDVGAARGEIGDDQVLGSDNLPQSHSSSFLHTNAALHPPCRTSS